MPWLQPLIDAPSSKYHLRGWDDRTAWMPESYISEGLIEEDFGIKSTPADGRNNFLLIVTNLAQDTRKTGAATRNTSHSMRVRYLMNDFRFKTGFQAHGLVRVLMWIHDQDKQSLLPRSICRRKKLGLQMEMICHAEEVVGGANELRAKEQAREEFLIIQSGSKVAQEMKRNNIQIPPERQDETQKRVQNHILTEDAHHVYDPREILINKHRRWHKELEQLEEGFQAGKFLKFTGSPPGTPAGLNTRKSRKSSEKNTAQFNRLVELQRNFKHERKNQTLIDSLFEQQAVIDSLELDAFNQELDVLHRAKKLKLFLQFNEKLKLLLKEMTKKIRDTFMFHRDDRKAFAQNPPLLMWDRRTSEPLIAQKNEFSPAKELALLDIQGNVDNLYPMTQEQVTQFEFVITQFFVNPSVTPYALDSIAPGAFDAIVPHVPALHDPFRGGRRDLSALEVRCFTPEMVHGITLAWDKWPFKPTVSDLVATTTGSESVVLP